MAPYVRVRHTINQVRPIAQQIIILETYFVPELGESFCLMTKILGVGQRACVSA